MAYDCGCLPYGLFVVRHGLAFDYPGVAVKYFLVLALALTGCVPAQSPGQVSTLRGELRAAVDLAKDAWVVAGQACIDVSEAAHDGKIAAACKTVLAPAHDDIVAAAMAVDALPLAATVPPPAVVCTLAKAMTGISQVTGYLGKVASEVAPLIQDASALANKLAGTSCGDTSK